MQITREQVREFDPATNTMVAYGVCVDTWSSESHFALVDDRMVVSEIGEIWSP